MINKGLITKSTECMVFTNHASSYEDFDPSTSTCSVVSAALADRLHGY